MCVDVCECVWMFVRMHPKSLFAALFKLCKFGFAWLECSRVCVCERESVCVCVRERVCVCV